MSAMESLGQAPAWNLRMGTSPAGRGSPLARGPKGSESGGDWGHLGGVGDLAAPRVLVVSGLELPRSLLWGIVAE